MGIPNRKGVCCASESWVSDPLVRPWPLQGCCPSGQWLSTLTEHLLFDTDISEAWPNQRGFPGV